MFYGIIGVNRYIVPNKNQHLPHDEYISESKDGPNYIVII